MARYIRSKAVHSGRNNDVSSYADDRHVRCARCGFICNLERDRYAPEGSRLGWGITNTVQDIGPGDTIWDYNQSLYQYNEANSTRAGTSYPLGIPEMYNGMGGREVYDPIVTMGCPQCGTLLYNK